MIVKARQYLARAVELDPGYPDNHLILMEAHIRWNEPEALDSAMKRYRKILPAAKESLTGPDWELSWLEWTRRWEEITRKARDL